MRIDLTWVQTNLTILSAITHYCSVRAVTASLSVLLLRVISILVLEWGFIFLSVLFWVAILPARTLLLPLMMLEPLRLLLPLLLFLWVLIWILLFVFEFVFVLGFTPLLLPFYCLSKPPTFSFPSYLEYFLTILGALSYPRELWISSITECLFTNFAATLLLPKYSFKNLK